METAAEDGYPPLALIESTALGSVMMQKKRSLAYAYASAGHTMLLDSVKERLGFLTLMKCDRGSRLELCSIEHRSTP